MLFEGIIMQVSKYVKDIISTLHNIEKANSIILDLQKENEELKKLQ